MNPSSLCVACPSVCVCIAAVRNNAATRNLNTLLAHMLVRLTRVEGMTEADTLNTVNLVFLGRTFLKFMLDVVDGPGVIAQLDAGTCVVPRVVPHCGSGRTACGTALYYG